MPGYLLLWDSDLDSWGGVETARRDIARTGEHVVNWSCGSRTSIPVGSRVFLKRTRSAVRGIVASGHTTGQVREDSHWREPGKRARYVPSAFTAMVDPFSDDLLPQKELSTGALRDVHWDTQGGGMLIPDDALEELEERWARHLAGKGIYVPPIPARRLQQRSMRIVRRILRDSRFSREVRARSGGRCAVCPEGLSYAAVNILEAAHIRSVEAQGPDDLTNGLPLCPNHHALFDEGFWSIGARSQVLVSRELPEELRATLAPTVDVPWKPDTRQVRWHREQVFKK
jgi:hypothetical protein